MRFTSSGTSISLLLVCTALLAGQLPGQTSKTAAKAMPVRQQTPNDSNAQRENGGVEVINGSTRWIERLDEPVTGSTGRTPYVPSVNKVDVITGSSKQSQLFLGEQSGETRRGRGSAGHLSTKGEGIEPAPRVEIINGTQFEMKSFEGIAEEPSLEERERQRRQRVVLHVESVESAKKLKDTNPVVTAVVTSESERGNATPVVVLVASSESKRAGRAVGDVPPVVWVTPNPPKRPPYHPETSVPQ
jgi:hypothetical protein